jgi:uncharacterized cupin superfamily protein
MFNVLDLTDGNVVDLGTHLSGSWGTTQLLEMQEGGSLALGDETSETCLYLLDGTAELSLQGGEARQVAAGSGITLIRGTRVELRAQDAVRVFVATLTT